MSQCTSIQDPKIMIDEELLNILACPETQQDLVLAEEKLIVKINALIEQDKLLNRAKKKVVQKIEGGLIRKEDQKYLYPIFDGIPVLLVDDAIPLEGLIENR